MDDRFKIIASHSRAQVSQDKSHASSERNLAKNLFVFRSNLFSDDVFESSDYEFDLFDDADGLKCYSPLSVGLFELSSSFYLE